MRVPVLPFVDLLILLATGSLVVGGVLKIVHVTTAYRSLLFGFAPVHFLAITMVLLLLAVALIGRSWLQSHEPSELMAAQRASSTLDAYMAVRAREGGIQAVRPVADEPDADVSRGGSSA